MWKTYLSTHYARKSRQKIYQCHAVRDKGEILCNRFENKFDATPTLTTIKEVKIKLIMLIDIVDRLPFPCNRIAPKSRFTCHGVHHKIRLHCSKLQSSGKKHCKHATPVQSQIIAKDPFLIAEYKRGLQMVDHDQCVLDYNSQTT